MKLTVNQLKKIIKEETLRALREADEVFDWKVLLDQVEAAVYGEFDTPAREWERLGAKLAGPVAVEAVGPEGAALLADLATAVGDAAANAAEGMPDEETLIEVQQHLDSLRDFLGLEGTTDDVADRPPFVVEEGPNPYSTKLRFGRSFSVTLSYEDAQHLATMIEEATGSPDDIFDIDNGKKYSVVVKIVDRRSVALRFGNAFSIDLPDVYAAELAEELLRMSED